MIDIIKDLERRALKLEPDEKIRKEWMRKVEAYGDKFLSDIHIRNSYDGNTPVNKLVENPIKKEPYSLTELLELLDSQVDNHGINPASGGHLGYIPGGGLFPTAMGDYIADITNRYAGIYFANPGAVRLENQLIDWMKNLVGYPKTTLGNLASGGSIANLIAITTARDSRDLKANKITSSVIYMTEHTHHCLDKAIRIAGLREAQRRYVPLDEGYRMDSGALENMIKDDIENGLSPFMIIASAGTTDVGAMDPLDAIADLAEEYNIWFHIDAAYGGFFIMVDQLKSLFKGIERSDSVVIDPHKGLFLSYGTGAVLIRNGEELMKSQYYPANYMQDAFDNPAEASPAELSPELTKHFRGLRMWFPLMLFGTNTFKAAIEEKYWLTQYFYEKIEALGFEVGPKPELSVAIYRYVPSTGDANEFNQALVKEIHKDGRVFLSSTTIDGTIWLRAAILSFRTHKFTVDRCLEMIADCVERVKKDL
jgi:glutamate/tyrosine decarboxylase-like PLP-dependent enzyme